jgi:hypothetical protein
MKLTLFSALLIATAGFAISNVETGDGLPKPTEEEWAARNRAFVRAKVFRRDATFDASSVDFSSDPNAGIIDSSLTNCTYQPDAVSGTTPKFDCKLANGDTVKVKYGYTKEIPSEIAATRLLHALGFGADRVSRVDAVRCYGCPFQPFHMRALWEMLSLTGVMDRRLDYSRFRDFRHVSVERNLDGESIEAGPERGWAFYELEHIDPRKGGATRAEVDALRLMAVFLHHWDNKTANQRLTCPGAESAEHCEQPLAMIQDVGSNFGPKKADLKNWSSRPVWADEQTCRVSMESMPYDGGTFEPVHVTEEGRQLLGQRLRQLSREQIESLFRAAGFDDVAPWTAAFEGKVKQIVDRPACSEPSRQSRVVSRQS